MKAIGIVAALSALLTAGNAFAQASYPDKPLRILVGFVAGGPADTVARVVGDKLTEAWGTPVVIENVAGSGGNMATERVAKAAPDGYTLLLGTSGPFVIHPSLYPKLPFDPVKDFAPITQLCFSANVLVVNNDVPAKSVAELVEALANIGQRQDAHRLAMELGNDRLRRAGRCQQREPGSGVEAGEARFDHSRQVGR